MCSRNELAMFVAERRGDQRRPGGTNELSKIESIFGDSDVPKSFHEIEDSLEKLSRPQWSRLSVSRIMKRLWPFSGQKKTRRLAGFPRCPPWRAKRRRVVPGSREATRDTRRAEGAKGDPKGASERGVQSYGRPVCVAATSLRCCGGTPE